MESINYFNMLKKVNSKFKMTKVITYEDMLKIPTGKEMIFNEDEDKSIVGTKISYDDGREISFRMYMPKGTKFITHEHDCVETIVMYQGLIKDGKKIVGRMENLVFPKNTKHTVEALEDSTFYVEFKKPK